jgi:hypothetical protein
MNFMGIYIILIIIYYNICEQDLSMDDPANHARLPDCSLHHASKDILEILELQLTGFFTGYICHITGPRKVGPTVPNSP